MAGLLTGQDIESQLAGRDLGDAVLVPAVAVRDGAGVFLDDLAPADLATALRTPVIPVEPTPRLLSSGASAGRRPDFARAAEARPMRPIIAIVGRPNVGKSTLFNRLVGHRRSLVRDVPGVTRDRLYGTVAFERWQAAVVDTGGFEPQPTSDLVALVRGQVLIAIEEADLILFK